MKPTFALTLSLEGISLLYRAFPGWQLVGEVALDGDDLAGDLTDLRAKAALLDPADLRCKLVLPDDQIKYLTIDTGDTDPEARRHTARTALEGATPYAVDDLAFDCTADGPLTHIAAVARETLAEAEAFAAEHHFNPVSFVAAPPTDTYPGEPFFGRTAFADSLPETADLERDSVPVRIIGLAKLPDPADEAALDAPVEAPVEPAPEPKIEQQADTLPPASDPDPDNAAADSAEAEAPLPAFTSIRARRDDASTPGPGLSGVTRRGDTPASPGIPILPDDAPTADDAPGPADIAASAAATLHPGDAQLHIPPAPPDLTQVAAPLRPATRHSEKQQMTVFGAREPDRVGGKPKYLGLMLTAALLLLMAGAAIWVSLFSQDGLSALFGPRTDETELAALPDEAFSAQQPDELLVEGEEAMLPDPEASAEMNADTGLSDTDTAVLEALAAPEPALTPEEAEARYAATGIWQIAPQISPVPAPITLDDFYVASIDAAVPSTDAIALPTPDSADTDARPAQVSSPATSGTTFALDRRGMTTATPEGAQTPEGVMVYLGRPPLTPPSWPDRPEDTALNDAVTAALQVAESDRLAALRPRARPGDLLQQVERTTLGGRTRDELARLRPRLRPAVDAAKIADESDETATDQAVAASAKPHARPSNIANIVARARANSQNQPVSEGEPTQAAAVIVPPDNGPRLPTTASVAKQATVQSAINLRKVNLIGVFGTASNRRALVRLANGRYQKVQVGDRIDGGKVAAIGETELRYVKGGRSVILQMPKG